MTSEAAVEGPEGEWWERGPTPWWESCIGCVLVGTVVLASVIVVALALVWVLASLHDGLTAG